MIDSTTANRSCRRSIASSYKEETKEQDLALYPGRPLCMEDRNKKGKVEIISGRIPTLSERGVTKIRGAKRIREGGGNKVGYYKGAKENKWAKRIREGGGRE